MLRNNGVNDGGTMVPGQVSQLLDEIGGHDHAVLLLAPPSAPWLPSALQGMARLADAFPHLVDFVVVLTAVDGRIVFEA